MSNNKYTNTITAAAMSLGVDVDVLAKALDHLRVATDMKRSDKADTYQFVIKLKD